LLFDRVVGHEEVKAVLRSAVETGRVSHAYMFTGPSAVGKFIVARAFAASILCGDYGCGECDVCRRVMEEKHPDVTVVRPAGKNIPVQTIRDIRGDAFRKPSESDRRVFIIKNAERMWEEGASTLLKVLEEPPKNVIFILVTSSPGGMLATIKSRCQEVRFSRIPLGELRDYLVELKGIAPGEADLVVRLTGGVLGRALDWCDESWRLVRRDNVIKAARALRHADLNRTLVIAQELYREVRAPVEEVSETYRSRKEEVDDDTLDRVTIRGIVKEIEAESKREQLKEEIRGTKEILQILSWWYRDILISREGGSPMDFINKDMTEEIEMEAESLNTDVLLDCLDGIRESIRAAEQNISTQLNIESTLLGIQEVLYA
jgi:DNA polymerase III subunit delta'